MSKTVRICIIVAAAVLAGALSLTLSLTLTTGSNKPHLKIKELSLKLNQEYELDNVISSGKYKVEVGSGIVVVLDGKIMAVDYGETEINFVCERDTLSLPVKVCADNIKFDTPSIVIYHNGDNNKELNLLLDETRVDGATYTFAEEIISYDGQKVVGKKAGETEIIAEYTIGEKILKAKCKVEVKQYAYVENVNCAEIKMNVNQVRNLDIVKYGAGEVVPVNYIVDEEYLLIDENTLTANKLGETKINVVAQTAYKTYETFIVDVIIENPLSVESVTYYKEDDIIDAIYYGEKANGDLEEYTMQIVYNKKPKAQLEIEGVNVLSAVEDVNTYNITFTKSDASDIAIKAVDVNDLSAVVYISEIAKQAYLQNIPYRLENNKDENIDRLYLYNDEYLEQAEEDGYYNELKIIVDISISIEVDENFLTIQDYTLKAKKEGIAKLTLIANDGSGLKKEVSIPITKIIAETMNVEIENCLVGEKITPQVEFTPIYCLNKITYVTETQYIDENFIAKKKGQTKVIVIDEISGITKEVILIISSPYQELLYNGEEITTRSLAVNEIITLDIPTSINAYEIKYEMDGVEIEDTDIITCQAWGQKITIIGLKVGKVKLILYENNKIVSFLEIDIHNI